MPELCHLARLYNVQTAYYDVFGRVIKSSPEGILKVLQALGVQVERKENVSDALRERRQSLWQQGIDPVIVAWDGAPLQIRFRIPSTMAGDEVHYQMALENGESASGTCQLNSRFTANEREIEGARYVTLPLTLASPLPHGYHQLRLEVRDKAFDSLIISSPLHAGGWPGGEMKGWGIFAPLYAVQSQGSWGAGDFSDLERVVDWVKELGGQVAGTLPLLAAFLDEPFDPSPYSPVSRLFWNEFYVDITRAPELETCSAAKSLLSSSAFQNKLERLRSAPLTDYRRQMVLKRAAMEELARCLFSNRSGRRDALRRFMESRPQLEEYAEFRAVAERQKKPWWEWPEKNRQGLLKEGDYDEEVKRYHLYVQWLAHEQIESLGEKTRHGGPALYLDLPLGVRRDGYDVWRERSAFAFDVSGGAPPDEYFTKGQNWGFPPLHPDGLRREGYRYFIAVLRHHLKQARLLRIDHVMGFHRLFWVPQGMEATDGVYVRYRPEEFYGILCLESHRHQAVIVGENLGTVPPAVNESMARHRIHGMYIGQFGIRLDPERALEEIPPGTVASLNNHDTATFAGFWHERDIQDRLELGLLNEEASHKERQFRASLREALTAFLRKRGLLKEESPAAKDVLKAWLMYLTSTPADLILLNLEDLWLEEKPQNVPGTWEERPNWRRKARYKLEEFTQMSEVRDALLEVGKERRG